MSHECPTCDRDDFDSEGAMKIHHSLKHGESLIMQDYECEHCGDTFSARKDDVGRFCSYDCLWQSRKDQVELECDHCGETFESDPSDAHRRRFCSYDCKSAHGSEKRECVVCGGPFEVNKSDEQKYCSHECHNETRVERPRPDDDKMLVWLLYVYEGNTIDETYRRIKAIRGYDDRMFKSEVREIVNDNGWNDYHISSQIVGKADEVFGETPEGDDSWKELYSD